MYEDAYLIYGECVDLINSKYDDINFLIKKATIKDRITTWSFIVGIIGILIGVAGIFLK